MLKRYRRISASSTRFQLCHSKLIFGIFDVNIGTVPGEIKWT
jgi:hypothetical protein